MKKGDASKEVSNKRIPGYRYIRTTSRDKLASGANLYAACRSCGDMVSLAGNGQRCRCGNIIVRIEWPKCRCEGGKERIDLYFGPSRHPNGDLVELTGGTEAFMRDAARTAFRAAMDEPPKAVGKTQAGSIWK